MYKTNDTNKQDYNDFIMLLEKYILNKSNFDKQYKILNQEQIKEFKDAFKKQEDKLIKGYNLLNACYKKDKYSCKN